MQQKVEKVYLNTVEEKKIFQQKNNISYQQWYLEVYNLIFDFSD